MADRVQAFILYNERESGVEGLVSNLESRGISTHFWRRDVPVGDSLEALEQERLATASTVLVLLGEHGWGPNHLRLTEQAQELGTKIVPVLIGDPPSDAFDQANALFREKRYADFRNREIADWDQLIEVIHSSGLSSASPNQFDAMLGVLTDGSEQERANILRQIQVSTSLDRRALSGRLRAAVENRFSPVNESDFSSAVRDPKLLPSIRSWMLSCLIWTDADDPPSRELLLRHVREDFEPHRNVRFWALGGLAQRNVPYLVEAARFARTDKEPEVSLLAQAITGVTDDFVGSLRTHLASPEFDIVWPVLRILRVYPIPQLVPDVCDLLDRSGGGTPFAYDALYALTHPEMAAPAAKLLAETRGVTSVVRRVLQELQRSNPTAVSNLAGLLAAFDPLEMDRALAEAEAQPEFQERAHALRVEIRRRRRVAASQEVHMAGYSSDTIDVSKDSLDIREDVRMLTSVMLAKEVTPPLAIGLFGDWGSGKSYFMKSMIAEAKRITHRAVLNSDSKFCSHIVSIEFNAWHYADTNLWASLVNYILGQLAAHVSPEPSSQQKETVAQKDLGTTKAILADAQKEKSQAQELITDRQTKLNELQAKRQEKELKLRDLRVSDFQALLTDRDKKQLSDSLKALGVPAALDQLSDLSQVVTEVQSVRGQAMAFVTALTRGRNAWLLVMLLTVALFAGPLLVSLYRDVFQTTDVAAQISATLSKVVVAMSAAVGLLRNALSQVRSKLTEFESAKHRVDTLLAQKRQKPAPEEVELEREIGSLQAQEQEAASKIQAATARVLELEERIEALREGRSLVRFLAERSRSDDYRKHLGLISTIRQDFEHLAARLQTGQESLGADRAVDRIILYIDDLDRCPANKVTDVLQAVHLLLAYPLFVVVVGVDPRWLLHSLEESYSAFQRNGTVEPGDDPDVWRTTPQNYLEKIFQVPFNLRRMTRGGYSRLVNALLAPSPAAPVTRPSIEPPPAPPGPNPQPSPDSGGRPTPPSVQVGPEVEIFEEALAVTDWEARFAQRLFGIMQTPRGVKRFSNTYRMLKAPVPRERLPQFEGTAELPGDFQVPMLLLAILIGAPQGAAELFPLLYKQAKPWEQLRNLGVMESPDLKRLDNAVRQLDDGSQLPRVPEVYRYWVARVARFSFEAGRVAVESEEAAATSG